MNIDAYVQELLEHVRSAIGTTLESPAKLVPAAMSDQVWSVRLTIDGQPWVAIAFDEEGASIFARASLGIDAELTPAGIRSALDEVCSHALSDVISKPAAENDPTPDVRQAELVPWDAGAPAVVAGITCAKLSGTVTVAVVREDVDAQRAATPAASASTKPGFGPAIAGDGRLDVLLDIDLPLVVRFGATDMPLKALARLGPGSTIDLSRAPDDPVEMLVGNRVVARGEVVVVSGSYGIRIVEVVRQRERDLGVEA